MIKAKATGKDKTIVILGLSHENLKRLKAKNPIHINLADIDIPGYEIFIFAGETEEKIAEEMKEFIGPDTKIKN
jgi:hypothetical protein